VPKICFLSHSTTDNLTRDWVATTAAYSSKTACKLRGPQGAADAVLACHAMHYGWDHCEQDQESGTARCQADITADEVWPEVDRWLQYRLSIRAA
jgi:hypothetical protein